MFELLLAVALVVAVAKIADADGRSPVIWSFVTIGLIVLSALIPVPMLRCSSSACWSSC